MGVIVRSADIYVPTLRSTLERFGIPARFYFDDALERHPVVRFLSGAVEAMLGGWDHSRTLAVLRLAPRFADFSVADRFDFDVREQVPNAGLSGLRSLLLGEEGQPRPRRRTTAPQVGLARRARRVARLRTHPQGLAARFSTPRATCSGRRRRPRTAPMRWHYSGAVSPPRSVS